MKHLFTYLALFAASISFSQAPLTLKTLEPKQSEHERCYAGVLHQKMIAEDPQYALKMDQFDQYVQSISSDGFAPKSKASYVIPIVFHVMHLGEAVGTGSNVSDEVIVKAVEKMNIAYRNVNNQGGKDTQIEFALAVRDPNGNCTNGITRTNMSSNTTYKNNGVKASSNNGIDDIELKNKIYWNKDNYYNVYIVTEFDNNNGGAGVQGFAYMAGGLRDWACFMASNVKDPNNKTLIHELGHALNLFHTFEGDNNGNACPPNSNPSTQGDRCADTPPHKRSQSDCNANGTNSCDGGSSNSKFVYNYLDYSSDACMRMFTNDQGARMRAACSGPRANMFKSTNLALVGPNKPTSGFATTQGVYCSGAVKLLDKSTCVPNTYTGLTSFSGYSFNWTVTNGTETKTSTDQNPTFNLSSPGWYTVTHKVTGPNGTDTKTVNNAFYYAGGSVSTCTPSFVQAGNFGINIENVKLNEIDNTTDFMQSGTYENFTCSQNTILETGQTYPMSVTINSFGHTSYMVAYIDWNGNGTYEANEKVLSGNVVSQSSSTQSTKVITGNITPPANAVKNKLLKMRVAIDAIQEPSVQKMNCTGAFNVGDIEEYAVLVTGAQCVSLGAFEEVCSYNSSFSLSGGAPAGGAYSGPGVSNGVFNPATAGVGTHTITYTVSPSSECPTNVATAQIVVSACASVEEVINSDLTVYPNPTSSTLNIKGNVENYNEAFLIDIQGRVVAHWNIANTTQFDVSEFVNGAYFFKVVGNNNSVVTKVELRK